MDQNLSLGMDLGYDLSLNDLPFSSSGINDVLMRLPAPELLLPLEEIPVPENLNEQPMDRTGEPTLQQHLLEHPEIRVRIQRLIESQERFELMRNPQSDDDNANDNDDGGDGDDDDNGPRPDPTTDPERLMHDIKRSGIRLHNFSNKSIQTDISTEVKNDTASEYDCNVCLELAKDPVVTCCGHLFCWPCLYQWLHARRGSKECPVCRGKVKESDLVPIYGRGSSEARGNNKNGDDLNQNLKIPPRPKGKRAENPRQQFRSYFFGGRMETLYHEVQELINESFFQSRQRNPQPHLRNQDEQRSQQLILQSTPLAGARNLIPQSWVQERVLRTPSQASTSSTMARIEGESVVPDASLEVTNNSRGGSSRVLRRSTRNMPSSSSGSSDVNGGARARQRRRMN